MNFISNKAIPIFKQLDGDKQFSQALVFISIAGINKNPIKEAVLMSQSPRQSARALNELKVFGLLSQSNIDTVLGNKANPFDKACNLTVNRVIENQLAFFSSFLSFSIGMGLLAIAFYVPVVAVPLVIASAPFVLTGLAGILYFGIQPRNLDKSAESRVALKAAQHAMENKPNKSPLIENSFLNQEDSSMNEQEKQLHLVPEVELNTIN